MEGVAKKKSQVAKIHNCAIFFLFYRNKDFFFEIYYYIYKKKRKVFFYINIINKIKGKKRYKGYSAVVKFRNHKVLRNFLTVAKIFIFVSQPLRKLLGFALGSCISPTSKNLTQSVKINT